MGSEPVEQGPRSSRLLPRIDRMLCKEIERVVPVFQGEDISTVTHVPRYLMILPFILSGSRTRRASTRRR